jgi:hypothetical protein
LASTLDPIKNLFTIRNLDFVLERLAVLAGYEGEVSGTWRKVWSVVKRLRRVRQQTASEQPQHHGIEQRRQNPRISKPEGDSETAR